MGKRVGEGGERRGSYAAQPSAGGAARARAPDGALRVGDAGQAQNRRLTCGRMTWHLDWPTRPRVLLPGGLHSRKGGGKSAGGGAALLIQRRQQVLYNRKQALYKLHPLQPTLTT